MKTWDYIIVGTGMGGGPLGLRLAQAGFKVLFIEKGLSPNAPDAIKGRLAEELTPIESGREIFARAGRSTTPIFDVTASKPRRLRPFMGSGVGGSSALYGMVLERFRPEDFKSWPISYDAISNYYDKAENLFRVRRPLEMGHPGNQRLATYLVHSGRVPYTLPLARDPNPTCGTCQSMLCAQGCKNDSGKICIEPAIRHHGAELLTNSEVLRIEVERNRVTGVHVLSGDGERLLRAKNVILAAGALNSPLLLLKTATPEFPNGLGNHSGLVGRNLMRHFADLYALKIDSDPNNSNTKELGFTERLDDGSAASVQSFGRLPSTKVLIAQMQFDVDHSQPKLVRWLFRMIKPILYILLGWMRSERLVMASILEDIPNPENRVWLKNGEIHLRYKINRQDQERTKALRQKLKRLFKPLGLWFIGVNHKNEMLAHVCGTCKMGSDPQTSVVGLDNRVHGLDNLYVVDSSFFPTSGGTNPALTIAANSLRIADILIQRDVRRGKAAMQTYP